ncbi:hypothetical protein [Flavobacterium marginilacus]|nr:hypothetical protein [Flavobacterium marginilacus]
MAGVPGADSIADQFKKRFASSTGNSATAPAVPICYNRISIYKIILLDS